MRRRTGSVRSLSELIVDGIGTEVKVESTNQDC